MGPWGLKGGAEVSELASALAGERGWEPMLEKEGGRRGRWVGGHETGSGAAARGIGSPRERAVVGRVEGTGSKV